MSAVHVFGTGRDFERDSCVELRAANDFVACGLTLYHLGGSAAQAEGRFVVAGRAALDANLHG